MNRLTRQLTSKKLDNHIYALALYFMHSNFARPHKTLANPFRELPEILASGIIDHIYTADEIVSLVNFRYFTGLQRSFKKSEIHRWY